VASKLARLLIAELIAVTAAVEPVELFMLIAEVRIRLFTDPKSNVDIPTVWPVIEMVAAEFEFAGDVVPLSLKRLIPLYDSVR
jgi:hypothetical protein